MMRWKYIVITLLLIHEGDSGLIQYIDILRNSSNG